MSAPFSFDTHWTEAHDAMLRQCVLVDRLSMSLTAEKLSSTFGVSRSKNAVIGRCHRIGVNSIPHQPKPKRAKMRKTMSVKPQKPARLTVVKLEILEVHREPSPEGGLTIMQLHAWHCRWPLSEDSKDPDFRYCGGVAAGAASYCGFHCGLAYQPRAQKVAA